MSGELIDCVFFAWSGDSSLPWVHIRWNISSTFSCRLWQGQLRRFQSAFYLPLSNVDGTTRGRLDVLCRVGGLRQSRILIFEVAITRFGRYCRLRSGYISGSYDRSGL